MHDLMFANQHELKAENLKAYAGQVGGIDRAAFDKCLDSGEFAAVVAANQAAGVEVGVRGTPAFFVNGQFINGAQPFENFKKIIDEELARWSDGH